MGATLASPQQLQQLSDALTNFRRTLPPDYTPSYYFSGLENGLYAFPSSQWDTSTSSPLHTVPWQEGEVDPRAGGTQLPDDPMQSGLWQDPNFQRDWQDYQLRTALSYGGSQADDSFQGLVANLFGNSFTLPALFAGGAMGANAYGVASAGGEGATFAGGTGADTLAGSGGNLGSALAPEWEGGTFAATGPSTYGGGGLLQTAQGASPYLTGGSYALKGAGAVTGNDQLSQAGTALGYAGSATGTGGSMAGDDWGSYGDWAKLAGTAVSAGATAYGAVNSANALNNQRGAAQDQSNLANALFNQTAPLRGLSAQQLQYYLQTGQLPPSIPGYNPNLSGLDQFMQTGQLPQAVNLAPTTAANRDVLEQQFGRAREQAINATPAGGQLTQALTGLEGQRALGVTQLYSNENQQRNQLAQSLFGTGLDISREKALQDQNLRKALFSSALGLGSGNAQLALGGLAGASQGFGGVGSNALKGTQLAGGALGDILGADVAQKRFDTLAGMLGGINGVQRGKKTSTFDMGAI